MQCSIKLRTVGWYACIIVSSGIIDTVLEISEILQLYVPGPQVSKRACAWYARYEYLCVLRVHLRSTEDRDLLLLFLVLRTREVPPAADSLLPAS